jgi:uncharacterized surface protein with fasciclin (FAS1) repeats
METQHMKRTFLKVIGLALVAALAGACGGTDDGDDQTAGTILELAERGGEISALALAARKAGLDDELNAPDSGLTVLAPSNDAFGLLAGQLGFTSIAEMIDALPADALEAILRYHILPTGVTEEQLRTGGASQATLLVQNAATVPLGVAVVDDDIRLTDPIGRIGVVNLFDVPNDNGVLHLIDRVMLPEGLLTVLQTLRTNPERFAALQAAIGPSPALANLLNGAGPVTLFAPTDLAFQAAAPVLATLTPEQIDTAVRYHIVEASLPSASISFGTPVTTLSGQTFTINTGTGPALALITDTTTTAARVTAVDIIASNGVVHVIDKVLIPSIAAP